MEDPDRTQQDLNDYLRELADPSHQLKVAGLVRLSDLNPDEIEILTPAWPQIDVRRRRAIVRDLLELEETNVELNFDAVFFLGLTDPDAEVRLESVRGLWEHEAPDLIAPLLRLAGSDTNATVRAEAALSLGHFVMLFEEGRLRDRYFRQVEDGLRRVLAKPGEVQEVRARALEAIGAYDGAWVRQAIREAYEAGVRRLKVGAVHAMGRSCEPRWLPLLVRELNNDEAEVRYEAAVACGSLGDERAVPHLVALLEDSDDEVLRATILALGEIGGREAREALLEFSRRSAPDLQESALAALSEIDFEEHPLSFRFRA